MTVEMKKKKSITVARLDKSAFEKKNNATSIRNALT